MSLERQLTSANVLFLVVDSLNRGHSVYPSPGQVWQALMAERKNLLMSNDVEWPPHYLDEGEISEAFLSDLETLIDSLALDQRPDNGLIIHSSGGYEYRCRIGGELPNFLRSVVTALWKPCNPPKIIPRHEIYRAEPDKPST